MNTILGFFPSARQKSATEFCGPCPSCGGDDRFIIWPNEANGGRFMCRGCGASGDGIAFLMQFHSLTYPEACKALGVPTKDKRTFHKATASQAKPTQQKKAQEAFPPVAWTTAATAFLTRCQGEFLKSSEAVSTICAERFIGHNTALACGLGWNPVDRYELRAAWGLPPLQGKTKLLIPKGLVIATRRRSGIVGLTVRCTADRPEGRPKYWQVVGSSKVPFVVGGTGQAVVLLESALDAVLVRQESQNTVAAVGMMGSSKSLDQATADFIRQAPRILACPDNDEAGHSAWSRWRSQFPKSVRVSPFNAKDLTDMHRLATKQTMQREKQTAPFVGEWLHIALEIA